MKNGDFDKAGVMNVRPIGVTAAVYLLYITLWFIPMRTLVECTLPAGDRLYRYAPLVVVPIAVLIYHLIGKGNNWARLGFATLVVLATFSQVTDFIWKPPASANLIIMRITLFLGEAIIDVIALVLLFLPASSKWFKAVEDLGDREKLRRSGGNPEGDKLTGGIATRRNLWQRILAILRNTDRPIFSYVWRTWLISLIPSIFAANVVGIVLPAKLPKMDTSLAVMFVVLVFICPWLETLIMWPILAILKRTVKRTLWVAAGSAVIWGVLHSLVAAAHGLIVAWPFFVFSICFLEWQKKSTKKAIGVTALIHMCQNTLPVLLMALAIVSGVDLDEKQKGHTTRSVQESHVTMPAHEKAPARGPADHAVPSKEKTAIKKSAK